MRRVACTLAVLTAFAAPASAATITALNEASRVGVAPAEVANSLYGNNDGITVGFNEASSVTLATDMTLGGTFLKAGTKVDSHLLYHDRFSGTEYITSMNSFSFSQTILSVIMLTDELVRTHDLFGPTGTVYKSAFGWFGLEEDERNEIKVTANTVTARFTVNNGFDAVRVLTVAEIAAVPVPASGLFLAAGLGALGFGRRRKALRAAAT